MPSVRIMIAADDRAICGSPLISKKSIKIFCFAANMRAIIFLTENFIMIAMKK